MKKGRQDRIAETLTYAVENLKDDELSYYYEVTD